jgi:hypothetical protein
MSRHYWVFFGHYAAQISGSTLECSLPQPLLMRSNAANLLSAQPERAGIGLPPTQVINNRGDTLLYNKKLTKHGKHGSAQVNGMFLRH